MPDMKEMFRQIEKSHPAFFRMHTAQLAHFRRWNEFGLLDSFNAHLSDWVDFTLQSAEEAARRAKREDPKDELIVYAANATRWATHQFSVSNLIHQGSYGESYAVSRMVLEQTDLIILLASEPAMVADWVDATGKPSKSPPPRWQPAAVRLRVEKIGAKTYEKDLYAQMSAAVHPSNWGNSIYASRVPGSQSHFMLTPAPIFDPLRSLELLGVALRTTPLPTWQFLRLAERRDFPAKVQSSYRDRYGKKLLEWGILAKYQQGLRSLIASQEESALQGTPAATSVEKLKADAQRLLEEIAADPPDLLSDEAGSS